MSRECGTWRGFLHRAIYDFYLGRKAKWVIDGHGPLA